MPSLIDDHVIDIAQDQIDGQRVHFVHMCSERPGAPALLLTHGRPSSFADFSHIAGPLGRDFQLVVPSIPGFTFSGPTREPGWGVRRVAAAWAALMDRLGYDRYGAQGGDFGSLISAAVSRTAPGPMPTGIAVFPGDTTVRRTPSARTTSCTGRSSSAAATTPPSRLPACSPTTSGRSSQRWPEGRPRRGGAVFAGPGAPAACCRPAGALGFRREAVGGRGFRREAVDVTWAGAGAGWIFGG